MLLPRPHLTKKALQSAAAHSLIAIVAPMGFGKTTLARAMADAFSTTPSRSGNNAVCYYAVPDGPHDGHFVWHDLCLCLEAQGLYIAPALLRTGLPVTASQARKAFDLLRGFCRPDNSLYLLVDDYHHVTDPGMDAFWERAAQEAIPGLHIALFSRSRPGICLEELHIKGLAAFFDQSVLTFSRKETEAFFRLNGVTSHTAISESQAYSEGWPAVLWLCLQSWVRNGRIIESGGVAPLLANMFFTAYSPEERDLLMRLSVLESFTEQDAAAIAASPRTTVNVRMVREKNPFLTFDGQTGHYQFHAIFREFLRKELAVAAHIDAPSLRRLAGERCLARQNLIAAIRLFHRAGRDEDLARLLDIFLLPEYNETLPFFQAEISAIVNSIPWPVRVNNPLGYLGFIVVCFFSWNEARAAAMLEEAAERFAAMPEQPAYLQTRFEGELEVMRGLLAFNDFETLWGHYVIACRLLREPSIIASKSTAWSFGSPSLSFLILREQGQYGERVGRIEENWHLFRKLTGGLGKGGKKMLRAEHALERGEWAEAGRLAQDVLYACEEDRHIAAALAASFCLARLAMVAGKGEEAVAVLERLRPRMQRLGVYDHQEGLDVAAGYVHATLGRLEGVPRWLRNGEMYDAPHNSAPLVILSLTVHCKALLAQGEYKRLALMAEDLLADTLPLECLFARIHGTVLQAVAAWHTRSSAEALNLLRQALELSQPDGILLPLAEYGGHLLPLLRRLKRHEPDNAHLEAVLASAGRMAHGTGFSHKKELLTPRECELMRHVADGETNTVIAAVLGITIDGVKHKLRYTYRKLGAANRAEAVRLFNEAHSAGNGRQP